MENLFSIAQFLNTFIFIMLSGLHFYWAFGGKYASTAVVPEISGKAVFKPSFLVTILVAFALLFAAWLSLNPYHNNILVYGNLAIGIVMSVRAIGDFKYVGFFKKIKETIFAKNDTYYYSPLCLLISLNAFYIYFNIK
jgi:Protein of unknown function (DUF3995)